nr:L,D-transpeptidase family protein [Cochlodiniinecator piscidefendens]
MGRLIPCSIGRGGLSQSKIEGDGATPTGVHKIEAVLYRRDRLSPPNRWAIPIRPFDLWSDDVNDPDYNQLVRAPYDASHEVMRRADPLYDIVFITDWNWPAAIPGKGSAIFLHQWRRPHYPTEGCIAFSREDLLWIAARVLPGTKVIVRD